MMPVSIVCLHWAERTAAFPTPLFGRGFGVGCVCGGGEKMRDNGHVREFARFRQVMGVILHHQATTSGCDGFGGDGDGSRHGNDCVAEFHPAPFWRKQTSSKVRSALPNDAPLHPRYPNRSPLQPQTNLKPRCPRSTLRCPTYLARRRRPK
jgi:hypothetical protein